MSDLNDEIIKRLDKQDNALTELTKSINEFAQIVARKEVSDQHFAKMHEDNNNRLNSHSERLRALEQIAAGEESYNRLRDLIWKAVIGLVVTLAGGGILWAVVQQFNGVGGG